MAEWSNSHHHHPSSSGSGGPSSTHGTGTPGGVSKWAKGWAKTFTDGAQVISEKWQGKKAVINDDPLVAQRQEINEYQMICANIQRMLLSLSALLDSVMGQHKAAEDLHRSVKLSELASSPDLLKTTETHLEGWGTICRHHDSAKGRLQTLRLEVKNHLTFIQQTQRDFELRDRKYRRMQEEAKRLQKQRFNSKPDPVALDRQSVKAEKATVDFRDLTTSLADRAHHILEGRQRYLQESTKNLFELQSEFFRKLSLSMDDVNTSVAGSLAQGAPRQTHSRIQVRSKSGSPFDQQLRSGAPQAASSSLVRSSTAHHDGSVQRLPSHHRSDTIHHQEDGGGGNPFSAPQAAARSPVNRPPRPPLVNDFGEVGLVLGDVKNDSSTVRQVKAPQQKEDGDGIIMLPPPPSAAHSSLFKGTPPPILLDDDNGCATTSAARKVDQYSAASSARSFSDDSFGRLTQNIDLL